MSSNGVPVVSDEEFHHALTLGLDRMVVRLGGKGRAAAALQMSRQNYIEVENGSVPHVKRLFEALEHEETLLDNIAALYRRKVVPDGHALDRAAPALVAALHKVIEAEADGRITHDELLAMEPELRDAEKRLCGMLQRISELRKPREVRV